MSNSPWLKQVLKGAQRSMALQESAPELLRALQTIAKMKGKELRPARRVARAAIALTKAENF